MPILVVCPSCSAKLRAPDAIAGRKIKCPKCGTRVVVPTPARESAPPPTPAKGWGFEAIEKEVPADATQGLAEPTGAKGMPDWLREAREPAAEATDREP